MAKKEDASLITALVKARIRALETASRGAIQTPQGSYLRALISATPKNPTLQMVAIKREGHETVIGVAMGRPGESQMSTSDFSIKGVLTEANAGSTGRDIADILGDKGAAAMCSRKLAELTKKPEGSTLHFKVGQYNRIEITDGRS